VKLVKSGNHRPPHIYKAETYYFVSSSTFDKLGIINNSEKKTYLKKLFIEKSRLFSVVIKAWVILENHYHLLFNLNSAETLSRFIGQINGASSNFFNKVDSTMKRKVWYKGKYWDTCIRSERDFWLRFNYIHHNPIKHGIIQNIDELGNYEFSSWNYYSQRYGKEWLLSAFEKYPVVDFTVRGIE